MNGQRARLGQVLSKAAARTLASWDPISACGAIYDLAVSGRGRRSAPGTSRILLTSLTGLAGVTLIARERLHGREEVIQKWTEQDKPAELAGSALVAQGVTLAGAGLARAFARAARP